MAADTAPVDFSEGPVAPNLDVAWIHGSPWRAPTTDPPIQVHRHDPHTVILRQSKAVDYEAPFLYLLFGNERALLLDTGATEDAAAFPLRRVVDEVIDGWLAEHPRTDYGLVVAHTHAHGDHVAGDAQFAGRPHTVVVGHSQHEVAAFFGFTDWPREVRTVDLGGRVLELTGIPGHHAAHIAVYDPWTGFLLTGDTVYRGRLYVEDPRAFVASLVALVELARARQVTHVLGCHIEMTRTPRLDYPLGTTFQPDEPPLQLDVRQLLEVSEAARFAMDQPGPHRYDNFALFIGDCRAEMGRQVARRWWARLRGRG